MTMPRPELERLFHEEMLAIYDHNVDQCNYYPTRFRQLVSDRGGLQAARELLFKPGLAEGLTFLWEHKRLDLSMEALILREPWSQLFSKEELAVARGRLQELGYNA